MLDNFIFFYKGENALNFLCFLHLSQLSADKLVSIVSWVYKHRRHCGFITELLKQIFSIRCITLLPLPPPQFSIVFCLFQFHVSNELFYLFYLFRFIVKEAFDHVWWCHLVHLPVVHFFLDISRDSHYVQQSHPLMDDAMTPPSSSVLLFCISSTVLVVTESPPYTIEATANIQLDISWPPLQLR